MGNKKLKTLAVSLLASTLFVLAGCDDIDAALPEAEKNEKVLAIEADIPHNNIQEIYEAILPSDSTTGAKTLDSLLLKLSESYFGEFYALRALIKEGNEANLLAFVDAHSRFQVTDAQGNRVKAKEIQGLKDFYAQHLENLQKKFWEQVQNSAYQERSFFYEKKFMDAQKASLYTFDSTYTDFKVKAIIGGYDHTHVGEYFGNGGDQFLDLYKDYVTRALLPDMYRRILTEDYLIHSNYLALGRSHARKVQTITLKNISDSADATRDLVTWYAKEVLEAESASALATYIGNASITAEMVQAELSNLRDLHYLSDLYSGTLEQTADSVSWELAKKLYASAGWESVTKGGVTYYPLTTLGATYKDYFGLTDVRWETGTSTDTFSSNGSYTTDTGLQLKVREAKAKTLVSEGWFTSSGTLELPSDIRSRLFKIQVANDLDSNYNSDHEVIQNMECDFGMFRNGAYYLTPETYASGSARPYLIFDSSSSSWVIVRVDEAVKGPKLATDASSTTSYDWLAANVPALHAGKQSQNEIVLTIADLLADSESYLKAAREDVLKTCGIKYHDQSVYDYFKSTYPDLFD